MWIPSARTLTTQRGKRSTCTEPQPQVSVASVRFRTLERKSVAATLDTSTSRALLENRGYCSEPLVLSPAPHRRVSWNSVDPRIPAYVHRLQRGLKERERARDGQTKHRAQGLAMQVTAPTLMSRSRQRVGQTKARGQGFATQETAPTLTSRSRQRVGQTKPRAQGLATQVTAPTLTSRSRQRVGQTKPRAQGLATQVTAPTLTSRSRQRVGQTKPRAHGPRDASDCTNRASKSGLARLRQHQDFSP